jgi:hypothetical protein
MSVREHVSCGEQKVVWAPLAWQNPSEAVELGSAGKGDGGLRGSAMVLCLEPVIPTTLVSVSGLNGLHEDSYCCVSDWFLLL